MRNTKKGFTLVELLVVIAILAILATVSVVGYTSFIDRANQSTALQEMTQIRDSVIAEDILNPNFSISGGTITVADNTDTSYPNFNDYVKSLTDALGEGRSCDELATGENALVLKNTDKKVQATWSFADNTIETDKYNGNDETPGGGEEEPEHTHVWSDATCIDPQKCTCGATQGEALGHKDEDVDGNCDNGCGLVLMRASLKYTQSSTTNMSTGNNATIVGLSADLFTVTSTKNSATVEIGLNKNGTIRLYASADDEDQGNGCVLTISMPSTYSILSVKINFNESTDAECQIITDETTTFLPTNVAESVYVNVYGNEITLKNVGAKGKQVYINSIEITYVAEPHNCEENAVSVDAVAPTCTEDGSTAGTKCSLCGTILSGATVDPATGHAEVEHDAQAPTCQNVGWDAYVTCENCDYTTYNEKTQVKHEWDANGDCIYKDKGCTETKPADSIGALSNATLSFESTANRTSLSTEQQVWEQNSVKLTNNKASSTNDIIDSSNPVRLYANSTVTVEGKGMKTVVIVSDGTAKYKTALANALANLENATFIQDDATFTIVFNDAVDSFEFSLTAQARLKSITVNP